MTSWVLLLAFAMCWVVGCSRSATSARPLPPAETEAIAEPTQPEPELMELAPLQPAGTIEFGFGAAEDPANLLRQTLPVRALWNESSSFATLSLDSVESEAFTFNLALAAASGIQREGSQHLELDAAALAPDSGDTQGSIAIGVGEEFWEAVELTLDLNLSATEIEGVINGIFRNEAGLEHQLHAARFQAPLEVIASPRETLPADGSLPEDVPGE